VVFICIRPGLPVPVDYELVAAPVSAASEAETAAVRRASALAAVHMVEMGGFSSWSLFPSNPYLS
jgi:hypothetical protein